MCEILSLYKVEISSTVQAFVFSTLPRTRFYLSAYADKHLENTFSIFINPKPLKIMLGYHKEGVISPYFMF